MPWGDAEAREPMFCMGCSQVGSDFVERMQLSPGPAPTPRVRICSSCHDRGWRLVGTGVEAGLFWLRRPKSARAGSVA